MKTLPVLVIFFVMATTAAALGMDSDKRVKLKDVDVLTLYQGKMTKGRRSSPMPQLECINEGTVPCSAFRPKVVQCSNRGSDGYDVQWECKSDMDNVYRFGEIEVSCEGYDYPDDAYILHGSCGLKYSLDYTKEGLDHEKHHDYYGSNEYSKNHHSDSYTGTKSKSTTWSIIADLIVYVGMGLIVYALYRTCTYSGHREGQTANSSTNDDYPSSGGGGGGYGWFGGAQGPPPYSSGYSDDASCRNRTGGYRGTGGGGFWTGAATGGLLGYMFGNNQTRWGQGGYRGWGGGHSGGGFRSSSSSGGSPSSGTRTASGFGGTSRR